MTAACFRILVLLMMISALLFLLQPAAAHCDTMDGPVVTAAKLALKTGDVTPVLKWVRPADESKVRVAFERAMKVRALSPEAREVADNYFFETLVRVHRAGEGEPYTGLKPAGTEVEPGIALADKVLETGSSDEVVKQVTSEVAKGIQQRFAHAQEARRHADDGVEAGRQYVAAYVEFIHYVENLHEAVAGLSFHAHQETQVAEAGAQQEK
jgi:hypothetical protein